MNKRDLPRTHLRKHLMTTAAAAGAAAVVFAPAPAAHASVIGVGNAVFGNACANNGSALTGTTTSGSGLLAGNAAQLPLDLPLNRCGNSGIVCDFAPLPAYGAAPA